MKILITGGAGNIGSVITNEALRHDLEVRVVDTLWFEKKVPLIHYQNPNYEFIRGDITDSGIIENCLEDVEYIVHAAAVVGDPASKKYPELTRKVNEEASIQLIEKAIEHSIRGILFFSTCSNYGISDGLATEESELKPLSLYAETKVNVEKYLMEKVKGIDWVIGRVSTVYGSSPRMRFDLTVNDFTMNGYRNRYLDIFLPKSFRPYIHVYDLANITLKILKNFSTVKNNVFNIGFPGENYQKIKIAETVKRHIPDVKIEILKDGGDLRDYQVDFSKLHNHLKLTRHFDVEKAVQEILGLLKSGLIEDFDNPVYFNTTPAL